MEAGINANDDTAHLRDAAAASDGDPFNKAADDKARHHKGKDPEEGVGHGDVLQKSHHEGAPFRNVFKAAAQKGNTATGKQANENSFKGKAQVQCRDMDHPFQGSFRVIFLHHSTPSKRPVKSRVAK